MIDLQAIFKNKRPQREKLGSFGFILEKGIYSRNFKIMEDQFTVHVTVSPDGDVDYHVYDAQTSEEYVLARVPDATGNFFGEVHAACEEILSELSRYCFDLEFFQNGQTKRVLGYIKDKFGSEPEFLWEKFPEFAAIRTEEKVWFALFGKVSKRKFGFDDDAPIEVVNLKNLPDVIAKRIEEGKAFPAYHMNKKYWFSIFLDDRIPDEELCLLIDSSFRSIKK